MAEKYKDLELPRGLARLAFRAPIGLYRLGLGWLLGHRFLLLTHTGRKSGQPRQTVLEVVRYDPIRHIFYVASGWGKQSNWYRNVSANPQVTIRSGRIQMTALAHPLSPEMAGDELVNYAQRHPQAMRELARFMGYRLDGSEADIRSLGETIPIIAFSPVEPSPTQPIP